MLDALIRAFLVVGGISAVAAWTWPGGFPQADPVSVLVRYHTPNYYTAVVAWYYVAPGVTVYLIGQFLISTSRIWFARMGVSLGLRSRLPAWPLSPTADGPAIVVGEVHHPVKPIESPTPQWLTIPRAGTLYRRGDFRGRRVRQDFGLYAPVRAPTVELASPRSRPATGGAHPGSQGRFLSRHPRDPQRRQTRSRLHRAIPRWSDYMESAECNVAGFVLARLHRGVTSESAVRQGERTILATGVHESRPLDHRTVPRAAPPPRRQRRRPDG